QEYAAPSPAPAAPQESSITQLKELAELKDQGILTEEEFAAQKAKILGS
ncbi:MAG: SHOCT domain-containing protein, partial [Thermoleophilia bacterium]|nr:SHOCT domain-containing protein [Thermoleophilia bacterium]